VIEELKVPDHLRDLCILEICPIQPSQHHRDVFRDYDLYFVSYKSPHQDTLSFNKNQSWAFNRNDLCKKVPKIYKYYCFIDYDLKFVVPRGKNFAHEFSMFLSQLNPAMAQPRYISSISGNIRSSWDEQRINAGYTYGPGGFITHLFSCFHNSILDLVFPIPTRFGGFWDAASYINSIIVPLYEEHIIIDYKTSMINLKSSNYAQNTDPSYGYKQIEKAFQWIRASYKNELRKHESVEDLKNYFMKKRISETVARSSPPDMNYFNDERISTLIDYEILDNLKNEERNMSWFSRNLMEWCSAKALNFIETGTHIGNTTKLASIFFNRVLSVEMDDELFSSAQERFQYTTNVTLWHGTSSKALPEMLKQIGDEVCVFWLDSHPMTPIEGTKAPILDELNIIKSLSACKNHIILIDDYPYFKSGAPGYPTLAELESLLLSLNKEYKIQYLPLKRYSTVDGAPAFIAATLSSIPLTAKQLLDGNDVTQEKEPPTKYGKLSKRKILSRILRRIL
jgi:hypothetical protein